MLTRPRLIKGRRRIASKIVGVSYFSVVSLCERRMKRQRHLAPARRENAEGKGAKMRKVVFLLQHPMISHPDRLVR
jgi:hypothetical protein